VVATSVLVLFETHCRHSFSGIKISQDGDCEIQGTRQSAGRTYFKEARICGSDLQPTNGAVLPVRLPSRVGAELWPDFNSISIFGPFKLFNNINTWIMSFGWSVGDIIAGLKILHDVYASVSNGYRNAGFQASGFFEEFGEITRRLDNWKTYKETISQIAEKDSLAYSYPALKERCAAFIKDHFALIQASNPKTISERHRRSTWLRNVTFTAEQAEDLYRKVTWPAQRATVAALRYELQCVLNLAIFDLGREAATFGRDNNTILRAMR
jgi:hypothetical protein